MKFQSHTSPDNLITLKSESTLTVTKENPKGFEDWIVSLTPGGWHIHPDPDRPAAWTDEFVSNVIEDRLVLQIWYKNDQIDEVRVLSADLETVDSEKARIQQAPIPGYSVIHRLWSGQILFDMTECS